MNNKFNKLPNIVILDEKDKRLRKKSVDVTFPLPDKDVQRIHDMMDYLEISQIEELREKYDLRAGMGLAYIQLGIAKRIFVIVYEVEEGKFDRYVVVNPKIKSTSEEMVYIAEGEGCLSINRPTTGIVPRHARMTLKAYNEYGEEYELRIREELAVAFQHELDHLDGILFTDRIDSKNPFKNQDKYRPI
ncbi:MAG TPA: peptide deformylase [Firmicutes bacterium]|nr:peptide deformylase [Bacillota bacterium]